MSNTGIIKELATNQDVIVRYMKDPQSVNGISFAQKKMLIRWNFADNIITAHPYWEDKELIKLIENKFSVSRYTAFYDLQNARTVFGSRYVENKPYWKQFLLNEAIKGMAKAMEKTKPDLKSHEAYARLIAGITGQYLSAESTLTAEMMKPANNFVLVQNNNQQLHLHLDKLEMDDPELIQGIFKSLLKQNELKVIDEDSGRQAE